MFLRLVDLDARTGLHIFKAAPAETAVMCKRLHTVVDIACPSYIGKAALNQRLDHADDLRHGIGDTRKDIGTAYIEGVHRLEIRRDVTVGNLLPCHPLAVRGVDDLVIHIRKVLNVADAIALA